MRRLFLLVSTLILVVAVGTPAWAQANDDPATDGTTGLFTVPRAGTVEQGSWSLGAAYGAEMREEGDSRIRTLTIMGNYGLTDRLEAFMSAQPVVKIDRRFTSEAVLLFMHPDLTGTAINDHPFAGADSSGFGDINVGVKYKFAGDPYEYAGLAWQTWFKLPTSEVTEGIGTGRIGIGTKLIASLEAFDSVGMNAYVGYLWQDQPDLEQQFPVPVNFPNFFVSSEFLYGFGVQVPTHAQLQVIGEWIGRVTTRDMNQAWTGGDDISMLQAGLRLTTDSGFHVGAAANYNGSINVRDPDWQVTDLDSSLRRWGWLVSAGFGSSRRVPVGYQGTEPMPLPVLNHPPTLDCSAERTTVRQGESVRLFATTSDPDNDMVTVTWNASAGSLSATTGNEVTWNSRGVPAGAGPITARASDGYGGIADCSLRVTVELPPPPPEPTILTFMCSEFPSGSARIDNRCKAVLDDVALQLRSNPGATAAITGHSDSTGSATTNDQRSQQRADNAKAYLVDTHSVDPSAVTTASAGSSQPMGDNATRAGRAQNRRITIVVTIPPR